MPVVRRFDAAIWGRQDYERAIRVFAEYAHFFVRIGAVYAKHAHNSVPAHILSIAHRLRVRQNDLAARIEIEVS